MHSRETFYFKLYMTWKIISADLKGLSKYKRMQWRFLNIFSRFRDIDVFLLCKLDQRWCHISGNIKAVFLKLNTINVHHKRNKMTPLMLLPWQQFCLGCCLNKNWNSQCLCETKNHLPHKISWMALFKKVLMRGGVPLTVDVILKITCFRGWW